MGRKTVDNSELDRWRLLESADVLTLLADHAKQDPSFLPRSSQRSTRWHATAGQSDFELLCTGPKFWDTRANTGGGGALDLAVHLYALDFKRAALLLRSKGV